LDKNLISREKADLTKGAIGKATSSTHLRDFAGNEYESQDLITLRCRYAGRQRTFNETFYIVESCHFDVMLRRSIARDALEEERSAYPVYLKPHNEGKDILKHDVRVDQS